MSTLTFLNMDLFRLIILPFLLVFAIVFALLEKSKILGDDKRQINAIVSLVVAAMFISFGNLIGFINNLIGFLVVAVIILFVYILLTGFIFSTKDGDALKEMGWLKITFAMVALIALVIAVLVITGYWDNFWSMVTSGYAGNIFLILIIVGAIIAVLVPGKSPKKDKDKKE